MTGSGEGILIINAGSSSVRYRLYVSDEIILDHRIDLFQKKLTYEQAGSMILHQIPKTVIIKKIAHRVVHGSGFKDHVVITPSVLKKLQESVELSPLHMPPALALVRFFSRLNVKQIACFDTVFHETMPSVAKLYAIPMSLTKKYDIRRYGFHGLAHQYMTDVAQKKYHASKIITCQLGNGISIAAVKSGKSIDTSMGFTPLEGVMMGTRSGSIDPELVAYLCKKEKRSVDQIISMLNKESGLKGIAGDADVQNLSRRKDPSARLALDMLCYQIRKQIGAYAAVLNGDAVIIFGGGIARNRKIVQRIMTGLKFLKAKVLVVDTDEQGIMYDISKRF
jgi:acetate kinase